MMSLSNHSILKFFTDQQPAERYKLKTSKLSSLAAGLCAYPQDYKYSSAKFYDTGDDKFGFLTHWMT